MTKPWVALAAVWLLLGAPVRGDERHSVAAVLNADKFPHYVDAFNAADVEDVVNHVPNAGACAWIRENVPLFECPEPEFERVYYYRWWTFRKHLKRTPSGFVLTE